MKDPETVWKTNDKDIQNINISYFKYSGGRPRPRDGLMARETVKIAFLSPQKIKHLINY